MKQRFMFLLMAAILLSSCEQHKNAGREARILPMSVIAYDTVVTNVNWHVYYGITVISPLPENLVIPRYESKVIPGDTAVYFFKYATEVPDYSESMVGKYEFHPLGDFLVSDHPKKIIRLEFWRDSSSTIDTILRFK